ncbi:long-chain-fatty-acid-CoA-ligase [Auriculariales sp. MPI-PUGE-AT-0066]|nr:long-chain-fatty-acid-CoA-ligase [Auriculariales sp. MPI-PUGE-AT-0066]
MATSRFRIPFASEVVETGPVPKGESRIHRSTLSETYTTTPDPSITTLRDVVHFVADKFGDKPALGWRDVIEVINDERDVDKVVEGKKVVERKTWQYFRMSGYQYISFKQLRDIVQSVARGLVDLGVQRTDILNIFAATSQNWQIIQHACLQIGTTIATAYATLGESGLTHSLNEPEVSAVFTNANLLDIFSRVLPKTPTVKLVIYDGTPSNTILDTIRNIRPGIRLISLDELRKAGEKSTTTYEERRPKSDDVACIMYTSGTTGNPKGVVLKHTTVLAAVTGGGMYLLKGSVTSEDTLLHYLPLAHILAYVSEMAYLCLGCTCGYGSMKTLSDQWMRDCTGDLAEFAPTQLIAVPLVFETIRKGILGRVQSSGIITRAIFGAAFAAKYHKIPIASTLADAIVFNGVKQRFGGKLRGLWSGSAPLSRETQDFFSTALLPIFNGYGLTESGGPVTLSGPEFCAVTHVGVVNPACEMKLLDAPELGYVASNNPPRGEILLRGPCITPGYYKRPDLNSDPTVFTSDGWFRTGDVGQWNPDGTLSVIDRVKNLVKLSSGEYVALERVEAVYKAVPVVSNLIVVANSEFARPIAIVLPHEANLRTALPNAGQDVNWAEICDRPETKQFVMAQLLRAAKAEGFKPLEIPSTIIVSADEWTAENEFLTAAQKVRRRQIEEHFKTEIQDALRKSQS